MKIAVVGVGYVGLSTAVCLGTKFPTSAIDIDDARVSSLRAGQVPIHEKGLKALLGKGLSSGRLSFSSSSKASADADAVFIAVGTPSSQDGSIDLSQVLAASTAIGAALKETTKKPLVLVKSTVVPGTARGVVKPLLEESSGKKCGVGFGLCSNPEFLREGTAIQDTLMPDRVVLGPFDELSLRLARALYKEFYGKVAREFLVTTPEGAELVKYGSNALLAIKVSFINLIARFSERLPGTDVRDVARGIGMDHRLGLHFLQAGPGFGGSCFSKDVRALSKSITDLGLDSSILESILRINEEQPQHVVDLAEKAASLGAKVVAVLGLAFKADTDDIRESRSIPLIWRLLEKGAKVRVYDPVAMPAAESLLKSRVTYASSARDCIKGADLAIAMTAWRQVKGLSPEDYVKLMRSPVLVDARRIYDPRAYSKKLRYLAVGLGMGDGPS